MATGSLLLTQISVDGSYLADILAGLLVSGAGIGLGFVTTTVAALTGVAEPEAGLASGLSNVALQIGGALGVAITTTVAVTRTQHIHTTNHTTNHTTDPLTALTEGYQSAFTACTALAATGAALALLLLRPHHTTHEQPPPLRSDEPTTTKTSPT